jgi:ribonuclease VapC
MPATVLDSFALIAFFRGETGHDVVAALLERAGERDTPVHMTEVNYAEVKYMIIRKDGVQHWDEIVRDLPTLPIEFHPIDRELSDSAADFKARHRLSLADAFAAALAKQKKAELVTGAPEFKQLEKEIRVAWLK